MEKNPNEVKCSVCNNQNNLTVILTCSHSICSVCFYKQIFFNYHTFNITKFNEEMELICVICEKGNHTISKKKIYDLLKAPVTENEAPVLCKNEHGLKIELFCKKCNWEMCEKCYEQHVSITQFADHQITTNVGESKQHLRQTQRKKIEISL